MDMIWREGQNLKTGNAYIFSFLSVRGIIIRLVNTAELKEKKMFHKNKHFCLKLLSL